MAGWTFVTNHARVFMYVARGDSPRLRDIAAAIDMTERAVHSIVTDLVEAGYLTRTKEGRRNLYSINTNLPMRAPELHHVEVGELLDALMTKEHREAGKKKR